MRYEIGNMKKEIKKIMGNKKFLLLLILGGIFMMTSVVAVWLFSYENFTGYIVSGSPEQVIIIDTFEMTAVSSTLLIQEKFEPIEIVNENGARNYLLSYNVTTIDDLDDDCLQEPDIGDFIFWIRNSPGTISNGVESGTILTFEPGITILYAHSLLLERACPGEYVANVGLIPIQ